MSTADSLFQTIGRLNQEADDAQGLVTSQLSRNRGLLRHISKLLETHVEDILAKLRVEAGPSSTAIDPYYATLVTPDALGKPRIRAWWEPSNNQVYLACETRHGNYVELEFSADENGVYMEYNHRKQALDTRANPVVADSFQKTVLGAVDAVLAMVLSRATPKS
jgi:hypothetical protein